MKELTFKDMFAFIKKYGLNKASFARLLGVQGQHVEGWLRCESFPSKRQAQLRAFLELEKLILTMNPYYIPESMSGLFAAVSKKSKASLDVKIRLILGMHQCNCPVCPTILRKHVAELLNCINAQD